MLREDALKEAKKKNGGANEKKLIRKTSEERIMQESIGLPTAAFN